MIDVLIAIMVEMFHLQLSLSFPGIHVITHGVLDLWFTPCIYGKNSEVIFRSEISVSCANHYSSDLAFMCITNSIT